MRFSVCHPKEKHIAKGLCKKCYDREYGLKNREKTNKKAREWANKNKERRLEIRRKYLYGIDAEEIKAIFKAQDGLCKICASQPAKCLDHDHKTGKTRGLLCAKCNHGLGFFMDNPKFLENAIRYLKLWSDFNALDSRRR